MNIIAISGFIGSGKDTVAQYLIKNHGYQRESMANSLKDCVSFIFSWPRELLEGDTEESRIWRETPDKWWSENLSIPDFTPRKALQMIGTEVLRTRFHQDVWALSLVYRLKNSFDKVVITDCRFPNEIDMIRSLNGKIIWVKRQKLPEWYDMAMLVNTQRPDLLDYFKEKYGVHDSEFKWIGTKFDYILENFGPKEDLESKIDSMFTLFNTTYT